MEITRATSSPEGHAASTFMCTGNALCDADATVVFLVDGVFEGDAACDDPRHIEEAEATAIEDAAEESHCPTCGRTY